VCAAPASPARGPRSPFAVSRPPNYLPLRSELNESRRVTVAIRRVSPPRQSPPDGAGGGRREGRKRTIARARRAMERNERWRGTSGGRLGEGGEVGKVGQVLSGYFPYPKWLNLIPNSGSRARHKSRHKHPRCYFLFLPRAFLPIRPDSPSSSGFPEEGRDFPRSRCQSAVVTHRTANS